MTLRSWWLLVAVGSAACTAPAQAQAPRAPTPAPGGVHAAAPRPTSEADCAKLLPACRHPRLDWVRTRFGGVAPRPGEETGHPQCVCDECREAAECPATAECRSEPADPCNPGQTPLRCLPKRAAGSPAPAQRDCDADRIPSAPPRGGGVDLPEPVPAPAPTGQKAPDLTEASCTQQLPRCAHPRLSWVRTKFGGAAPAPGEPTGFEQCVCDACATDADCPSRQVCRSAATDPCNPDIEARRCLPPRTVPPGRCLKNNIPSAAPGPGKGGLITGE